jgi:hypothetical protein
MNRESIDRRPGRSLSRNRGTLRMSIAPGSK